MIWYGLACYACTHAYTHPHEQNLTISHICVQTDMQPRRMTGFRVAMLFGACRFRLKGLGIGM